MRKLSAYEAFKVAAIVVIVAVLFFVFRGCMCKSSGGGKGDNKPDTVKVTEVKTIEKVRDSFIYVPQPRKTVYLTQYKTDTLETTEVQLVDSANILREYLATNYYLDTATNAYGITISADTVSRNKILGKSVITQIEVPTITKTITISEKYPRKVVLFVGGGLVGNKSTPIWGAEGNLSLQGKNLKTYSVGYMFNKTGDPFYTFRFAIPIRFGKH